MNGQLDLRTLQRWFAVVVEHLDTAAVAIRSAPARQLVPLQLLRGGRVLAANPRQSGAEQLQVYNGGYLARLVEVLQGDYGAVQHVLGEEQFRGLVARYLRRHPSRHPNLNQLGGHFPAFVKAQRNLPARAFLAELAELELALCRAFDAPEFTPVPLATLQAIPAAAWPKARLRTNPSVQLLATRFPVGAWYQAWKAGEVPAVPTAQRAWTLVFRRDDKVWRQQLAKPAYEVLAALHAGQPFGHALDAAAGHPQVGAWFQEWAGDGLFGGVVRSRTRPQR